MLFRIFIYFILFSILSLSVYHYVANKYFQMRLPEEF